MIHNRSQEKNKCVYIVISKLLFAAYINTNLVLQKEPSSVSKLLKLQMSVDGRQQCSKNCVFVWT